MTFARPQCCDARCASSLDSSAYAAAICVHARHACCCLMHSRINCAASAAHSPIHTPTPTAQPHNHTPTCTDDCYVVKHDGSTQDIHNKVHEQIETSAAFRCSSKRWCTTTKADANTTTGAAVTTCAITTGCTQDETATTKLL